LRGAVVLVALFACLALAGPHAPLDRNGFPKIPCLSEHMYENVYNRVNLKSCATKGKCDNSTYRDTHGNGNLDMTLIVHIMYSSDGVAPDGVTPQVAQGMLNRVAKAYGSYGINLNFNILTHNDDQYYCIPGYSASGTWNVAIQNMKKEYAVNTTTNLNVFISCMDPSIQGTLFGIATFPWDPIATTATGGLWLNTIACDEKSQITGDNTMEHELGHCLGLWHTFHGSDEVIGCNLACEELPHALGDPAANNVGDFCSDTPATPRDYNCASPSGKACNGEAWGDVDYTNYMGYAMEPAPCGDHFTDQQAKRMHCWVCDAVPGLATGC
jgi:hypothetical protein